VATEQTLSLDDLIINSSNNKHQNLYLSSLAINEDIDGSDNLIGSWCLNKILADFLKRKNITYEVIPGRNHTEEEFREEANLCFQSYEKYIQLLRENLNAIHGLTHSVKFWDVLLNEFLYINIASVIDHYKILIAIKKKAAFAKPAILDINEEWINPHISSSGSSRLYHFLVYSLIISRTDMFAFSVLDNDRVREALSQFGDGKKSQPGRQNSENTFIGKIRQKLFDIKRLFSCVIPIQLFRYTRSNVLALGDQYLGKNQIKNFMKSVSGLPYSTYANTIDTRSFRGKDRLLRNKIKFPKPEDELDLVIQESIKELLPTIFLENFSTVNNKVRKSVPNRKLLFLNSQHCSGGAHLNFYIANSTELYSSKHLMICHGGCYGAMEVSVQEKIWARFSDYYALWANAATYGDNCITQKMPSLRFHNICNSFKNQKTGGDILVFLTGHYPSRYAYNSIFPYTMDEQYTEWQLRFLNSLNNENNSSLVLRDFHNSDKINDGKVFEWAGRNHVRTDSTLAFTDALLNAKLSIQTVPQTTYLETIVADHPTVCYWNWETNFIRHDLEEFYQEMIDVGVFHKDPESAAEHVNKIAHDPLRWWKSTEVRSAVKKFRENVCMTRKEAFSDWESCIKGIVSQTS
jgi:putative transferase (TIGR04331 family)